MIPQRVLRETGRKRGCRHLADYGMATEGDSKVIPGREMGSREIITVVVRDVLERSGVGER